MLTSSRGSNHHRLPSDLIHPDFHHTSYSNLSNSKSTSPDMAKATPTLFEVPIGDSGKVTVNEVNEKVYLVTFASPPDNRLTTVSCHTHL
jgi:hypothetical protein